MTCRVFAQTTQFSSHTNQDLMQSGSNRPSKPKIFFIMSLKSDLIWYKKLFQSNFLCCKGLQMYVLFSNVEKKISKRVWVLKSKIRGNRTFLSSFPNLRYDSPVYTKLSGIVGQKAPFYDETDMLHYYYYYITGLRWWGVQIYELFVKAESITFWPTFKKPVHKDLIE